MPKAKASAPKTKSNNNSNPTASIVPFESAKTQPSNLDERIRERAYELFLERGGQHGTAEEDWVRAEAEILGYNGRRTA